MIHLKLNFWFFIFAVFIGLGGRSQNPSAIPLNRIDSLMDRAMEMNLFSGNVLIVHDQKIVYEKSFGKSDYEKNIPNKSETKFQLASITKDFTRVMILQLIEQNKLRETDVLGTFLKGFSSEANKVTVHQLMDFSSGFGDYHRTQEFQSQEGKVLVVKDLLPIIQKEKLQFEPGSQVLYSNSGYVLLAAIIEKVTGRSYYENLKDLILDKLSMTNTSMNGYVKPLEGIAKGYLTNQIGTLQNNSEMHLTGGGDGGIYTSTHDLLAFITSVFCDNKLLNDQSKLKYAVGSMSPERFATWTDFMEAGRYSPAGGAPGVSALFTVNMKTKNIVIILSNYDQGTAEELGMRVSAILNNRLVPPLHPASAKYLFEIIKEKGGIYFEKNYKQEMQNSGMRPDDDMVLLEVGEGLKNEKLIDQAISLYKVYTTEFPSIIISWNELGELYLSKSEKLQAKFCFEKALQLMSDNKRAQRGLSKSQ